MMILKTYARVFTQDLPATLALFEQLIGRAPDICFTFGEWELIAIGDVLLVGGSAEALAPIRGSHGPLIVADLAQAQRLLEQAGAVITQPPTPTPTGTMLYARHPDGNSVEYVQWLPELVARIIG
ncbi:VOC family protein [Hymenobacter terrenus]|uniref:VOC family protein n=1 Tax=Hymenobacter terrenus TaxID=1629124 RepID=UPI0006987E2A|nr:VOC family protein [Hymenobacter terrenus]